MCSKPGFLDKEGSGAGKQEADTDVTGLGLSETAEGQTVMR